MDDMAFLGGAQPKMIDHEELTYDPSVIIYFA